MIDANYMEHERVHSRFPATLCRIGLTFCRTKKSFVAVSKLLEKSSGKKRSMSIAALRCWYVRRKAVKGR